jgi:hypothetical protein
MGKANPRAFTFPLENIHIDTLSSTLSSTLSHVDPIKQIFAKANELTNKVKGHMERRSVASFASSFHRLILICSRSRWEIPPPRRVHAASCCVSTSFHTAHLVGSNTIELILSFPTEGFQQNKHVIVCILRKPKDGKLLFRMQATGKIPHGMASRTVPMVRNLNICLHL